MTDDTGIVAHTYKHTHMYVRTLQDVPTCRSGYRGPALSIYDLDKISPLAAGSMSYRGYYSNVPRCEMLTYDDVRRGAALTFRMKDDTRSSDVLQLRKVCLSQVALTRLMLVKHISR